MYKKRAN